MIFQWDELSQIAHFDVHLTNLSSEVVLRSLCPSSGIIIPWIKRSTARLLHCQTSVDDSVRFVWHDIYFSKLEAPRWAFQPVLVLELELSQADQTTENSAGFKRPVKRLTSPAEASCFLDSSRAISIPANCKECIHHSYERRCRANYLILNLHIIQAILLVVKLRQEFFNIALKCFNSRYST